MMRRLVPYELRVPIVLTALGLRRLTDDAVVGRLLG